MIRIAAGISACVIVIGYAMWRSLDYARGPRIMVAEPTPWQSVYASTTVVHGMIERAHAVTLNGKSIAIDETGRFIETVVVFPGTNVITLIAQDQFDRTDTVELIVTRPNQED